MTTEQQQQQQEAQAQSNGAAELPPNMTHDPLRGGVRYLTVHECLGRILAELPAIGKDQQNREQGFAFRGIDDVLNALNPLLSRYGVFYVPDVLERVVNHRTTRRDSTMYEVNLHVRYTFYGPAGDSVTASGWGEGTDMGDKATNKAMTGAMKYVLFQVFAIATKEASDLDTDRSSPEETTAGPADASGQELERAKEGEIVSIIERLGKLRRLLGDYPQAWRDAVKRSPTEPGTFKQESLEEMATGDRPMAFAIDVARMHEVLDAAEAEALGRPCAICGRTRPRKQIVDGADGVVVRCERVKDCEKHAAEGGDDNGDPEDEQAPAAASEAPLESRGVAADDEAASLPGRPCGGDTAEGCGEEVPDGDVTYDDAGVAFHTACNPQLG